MLKQKLDLILQNQSDFHEQWQNDNTRHIRPNEADDVMSQFPIETDNSLNELEEALIDNYYRTKLVKFVIYTYIPINNIFTRFISYK